MFYTSQVVSRISSINSTSGRVVSPGRGNTGFLTQRGPMPKPGEGHHRWELFVGKRFSGFEPTPRKINMEPENTPLEEENDLPKPSFSGSMLILGGEAPEKLLSRKERLLVK